MSEVTVWVVNFSGHDYSDAQRFGEIDFLTKGYISRGSLDRMLGTVAEKIARTSPSDWLLPSGLIPLNVLAAACWFEKHNGLRLLLWDDKHNRYRKMEVGENHIPQLLETFGNGTEDDKQQSGQEGPEPASQRSD